MPNINDLWYAARQTRIVYMPHKLLETFGESAVNYRLLSQVEDGRLRLRTGIVKAARPRIITPHFFARQALENFGEDARKYFEDVLSRKEGAGIIQYGLGFAKEDRTEEIIGGEIAEVSEQIAKEAQDNISEIRGVIVGNDKYWEISLLFFIKALVAQSAPVNAREMAGRGLFAIRNGVPMAIHNEIEQDFANAVTKEQADKLGSKLRDYGLFDEYEDRFFNLYENFC